MSEPVLKIADLSIGYDGREILSGLNLEVKRGEVVAILGANGGGKSTLLHTISATLPPISGSVTIDGENVSNLPLKQLARKIAVVNTERTLAGGLTVEELVSLGRQPYTGFFGSLGADDNEIVERAMADLGVDKFSQRSVASLSDGERQKVMIARAVAQTTPLMLLDEPTSFLDVASRLEIFKLLNETAHQNGIAVLISTHDVATALRLSDTLWVVSEDAEGQKKISSGAPKELIKNGTLETMFRGRHVCFSPQLGDFLPC